MLHKGFRHFILLCALVAPSAAGATDPSTFRAADPAAPAVTAGNLLESERFWPYRVALRSEFTPAGAAAPLPAGSTGILVRAEDSGRARIHFGRDGCHEVPVERTNVVEAANRIRAGEEQKIAPNFVHMIGTRLVDTEGPVLRAFDLSRVYEPERFVAVFADPSSEDFEALVAALAPLRATPGTMTVLFPQGEHPDPPLRERLRALGWPVPFLRDEYGEGYTRSLRPDDAPQPTLMLLTPEGRMLLDQPFAGSATVAALRQALGPLAPSAGAAAAAKPR